jgi:prepilin-type N-terminal cleavage/methylation domain-containing protein
MRRLHRRAGFTLLELMVALTIGAMVVTAVFALGGGASHHFQEQQRVGQLQRAVRMAMDRFRRDAARAGFGMVPATGAPGVFTCPTPSLPRPLQGVGFTDGAGNDQLLRRAFNNVSADEIVFTGNFETSDRYLVRGIDGAGARIFVQTDWLAFRRSFGRDLTGFTDTFAPGRMVHLEARNGSHFFLDIASSFISGDGSTASITVDQPIGAANPCLEGLGEGATVSPVSQVRYRVQEVDAADALAVRIAAVTGQNTQLVREEINLATGAVVDTLPVLDFVVDFNIDFVLDSNLTPGNPPQIAVAGGDTVDLSINAWRVRGIIASLTARSPEQDARFPWPDEWVGGRPTGAPLNRYQAVAGVPGASRVRGLTTEIQMPNMIGP